MNFWPHGLDAADFWDGIFDRKGPVEIEIGSGDGAFLEAWARQHPEGNFLGIERSPSKARRLADRFARRAVPNVRTLQADARWLVSTILPAASVAAYHVYFPDPWPKRGHAPRRIFTTDFVQALARTLVPAGRLWFATDVATYAVTARRHVLEIGAFRETGTSDLHPGLTTSFARKYRAAGRELRSFVFECVPEGDARSTLRGVEDQVDVVAEVHADQVDGSLVGPSCVHGGSRRVPSPDRDRDGS